jgi:hypothetical protein
MIQKDTDQLQDVKKKGLLRLQTCKIFGEKQMKN